MSNLTTTQVYAQEIESERHQAAIYIDTYYVRLLAYEGYKNDVVDIMADLPKDAPLLDVGCGTGWFLSLLERKGWRNLSGLDISPHMLAVARDMGSAMTLHEAPIEEFSVATGEGYEVITCLGSLHHMPNLDRVANSLAALLRPGGTLIVHEPNEDWFYEHSTFLRGLMRLLYAPLRIKNSRRVRALRAPWASVPPSPHHDDVAVDELVASLQKAGFVLEQACFKNTLVRVLEGMLFRESAFDRALYRLVRWADKTMFDPLAGKRAGAALLRLRKPGAA